MCFLKKLGREKGNLLAVTDEVQVHGSENGLARGLGAHGCKKRGWGGGTMKLTGSFSVSCEIRFHRCTASISMPTPLHRGPREGRAPGITPFSLRFLGSFIFPFSTRHFFLSPFFPFFLFFYFFKSATIITKRNHLFGVLA